MKHVKFNHNWSLFKYVEVKMKNIFWRVHWNFNGATWAFIYMEKSRQHILDVSPFKFQARK